MRYVECSCGLTYDGHNGARCPRCGKAALGGEAPPGVEDKIRFFCDCGAQLAATARFAGKFIGCPACGKNAAVPLMSLASGRTAPTARATVPSTRRAAIPPEGWRRWGRLTLLLALIPLAVSTMTPEDDRKARIQKTLEKHPKFRDLYNAEAPIKETLDVLPSKRIEGAFLPRTTWAHWIAAAIAACLFWEFILIIQPMGRSTSRQLWGVGIFTGTVGILMLLTIQVFAFIAWVIPAEGVVAKIVLAIPRFIAFSYRAATEQGSGFWGSMFGFTVGVGLLEELCKALPLYWHYRKQATLDVRGAVVWGLASGIGFGVSEGISYSNSFYNGIFMGGIYVVRFISCVGLHAVWSASCAVLIWERRERIHGMKSPAGWILPILQTLWVSILLHGLYDTLLKRQLELAALATGVLSFVWFFWLYERASRREPRSLVLSARGP